MIYIYIRTREHDNKRRSSGQSVVFNESNFIRSIYLLAVPLYLPELNV